MKAIVTLIFVLLIGFTAQAKNGKVERFETGYQTAVQHVETKKDTQVARLYRRSNSLVKKELNFTTKRNRAKTA